jgi:hypothetical protein
MAVSGPWGNLSKVTDPFSTSIVTQTSTPVYDQNHNQVDHLSIAGAVTIELSNDEREQASTANQLWAQGGTPDDPVLAQRFPGPQYGFAALRCATDALNRDNIEYIYFPAGVTHVFCYTFYVVPPPTSGTITIEKKVVGAPAGENPSFAFVMAVLTVEHCCPKCRKLSQATRSSEAKAGRFRRRPAQIAGPRGAAPSAVEPARTAPCSRR